MWGIINLFPSLIFSVFTENIDIKLYGIEACQLYFFGFFMMAGQTAGQSSAVALGRSKQAVFFSLLRKAFIVMPLTLILPRLFGLGVKGVFLAEPISNFIGGGACYITMLFTIWKELKQKAAKEI